ncbi:MAG: DNA mismatch repair protein [Bacteroidota bacterium]
MSFIADKQTLDDLNLLGKYKSNAIFGLFNKVVTDGGEKLLEQLFRHPLTAPQAINHRSMTIRWFGEKAAKFPFDREEFTIMENYLGTGVAGGRVTASLNTLRKKFMHFIGLDKEYPILVTGLYTTIALLNRLDDFLSQLEEGIWENPFRHELRSVKKILSSPKLAWLAKQRGNTQLPLLNIVEYDTTLRLILKEELENILQVIYQVDVFIAVSAVARTKGFAYALALPRTHRCIDIRDCRHPGIELAVANSVNLRSDSNVLFLTGANMAGKSTFMKSFSIALYLAHMGFPVAASVMEFSVRDGIYTSINVPDNLQLGYSHFYAEVRRVKTVATDVAAGKNLLVIFDELFKGTNVKDAYDATLAVTEAFSKYHNCIFIISTHIIEVAEALGKKTGNLQFVYFPTVMEGSIPRYTYQLQQGVTSDRHGMMIIENEGILTLLA